MSCTNRGTTRRPLDFYETPEWCVTRLLERLSLPMFDGRLWLEPCAGAGAIIRAVGPAVAWDAYEIDLAHEAELRSLPEIHQLKMADFLVSTVHPEPRRYGVVLTNPPYKLAQQFVDRCLRMSEHVVMLLRLNFLESKRRREWLSNRMPDVYVLPNRPSFTGGGTDGTGYGWFHWNSSQLRRMGKIEILELTPDDQRENNLCRTT